MKFTAVTLISLIFTMCNNNQKENTSEKSENFDWLIGNWQRANEEQGKATFENWEKSNESEYNGIGFTLQNNDTISQEQMKILKTDGQWNLWVKSPDEIAFTRFQISGIEEDEFECKNDTLSFPKLIKYWKNRDQINALVSGDDLELSFEFERAH